MRSEQVIFELSRLRTATERLEYARRSDELKHAIAERSHAVERVALLVSRERRAFATEDLVHLRELYLRGDAVLAGLKKARQNASSDAARLEGMRRIVNSYSPNA